jgi:dolichyl-diphosphooligosaccharide--protein glycosyltransferase
MKLSLKKYWWLIALFIIFLFSYYIRAINIVPDRLLSFDPIFQYRFTKYFVDWGHLPLWDELSYYVGRPVTINTFPPFMWELTGVFYQIFKSSALSLMTVASYMSAIYGAMIVIPAFLLGKELSNEYGGLMNAVLLGTAPQILIRTFGSSYDNDQLVMFFMILTLYLGIYALRKRTISSVCLAIIGFTAYMLTWWSFLYPFIIVSASIMVYLALSSLFGDKKWSHEKTKLIFSERLRLSLKEIKIQIIILILIFVGLFFTNIILTNFNFKLTIFEAINSIIGFAQKAEAWIVNVSIAELQPFDIFNLEGWILAMGRFITGNVIIDYTVLLSFVFVLIFGIVYSYRKNLASSSFLITLLLISIVTTTRGIRFTEFSSAFFITLIAVGFGSLIEWSKRDKLFKASSLGLYLLIIMIAIFLGYQIGQQVGPDINSNWDNAWTFLKTQTPEMSLVGTWWDPGHMITGLAERRVMADGAHCGFDCMYTINDRIVDLGKIMVTTDENESLKLIRKYQGDSPDVYWIASDDLIGKFQWLQYFGTGCDARSDNSCPLYIQIPEQSTLTDNSGNIVIRNYSSILLYSSGNIPIPIYTQGINAAIFDEIIIYNGTQPIPIKFTDQEKQILINGLSPLEKQLNIRFTNQSIPMTVWMPQDYSYIIIIPPNLRESVFTKMFFLEGQGLEHFKQVFRNDEVKIYEVI